MATAAIQLIDANIVVNAYGQSAAGVWPHFRLLIDGVDVGQATVNKADPTAYRFTAKVAADQPHKVHVYYDNDGVVSGEDRDLSIRSIVVNGSTLLPSQATYDRFALDGQDVIAGQEDLWWQGALVFDTPASCYLSPLSTPATGGSTIVVNARGNPAAGVNAHFKLLVDGQVIGEGAADTMAKDFIFTADIGPGRGHAIQIQYDNDTVINGQDRSLIVNTVTINGRAVAPTDGSVTYDKGALDGKDTVKGQSGLWWNGTLVVNADKSFFPLSEDTPVPPAPAPAFYVATNGNDGWSGKLAAPNADGTDGPFATMEQARDAMRADPKVTTTLVRGGDYYVDRTLELTAADSGKTFAAYSGETPTIHGGHLITNWSASGGEVWSAALSVSESGMLANADLIVGGVRQNMARFPDRMPDNPIEGGWLFADASGPGDNSYSSFRFREGDIPTGLDADGMKVNIYGQRGWDNYILDVSSIDHATNTVHVNGTTWDALGAGSRYYLMNAPTMLNAPEEWYIDGATQKLYFVPNDNSFNGGNALLATTNKVISVTDAKGIVFDGISVDGTMSSGVAYAVDRSDDIVVRNAKITNAGVGIHVTQSTDTVIVKNEVAKTNGHGVLLEHGADHTLVSGNWIHDIGVLSKKGSGIWFDASSDNVFSHNNIENIAKFGIGGGSLESGDALRNVVEYNVINNTNQETSDGGAVMLINWSQVKTGDVIRYNEISNTKAVGNIGWDGVVSTNFQDPTTKLVSNAIYLDDWASGVDVYGNLLHDNIGGIFVHSGWDNSIHNNIVTRNSGIALAGFEPNWLGEGKNPHAMQNNVFSKNIVDLSYPSDGQSGATAVNGAASTVIFDNNVYSGIQPASFHATPVKMPSGYSGAFGEWQDLGYDLHSIIGNPLFKNPAEGDWRLQPDSPAYMVGFADIAYDQIGTHGYDDMAVSHWAT
ncbi:hypothetical protein GBZ26_09085 [Azospirillum formosense]|uniref:Parallel beta helix pectate lyase-like protein n=1 Tax=Azospirillum formosense TaxID=861533 RepID=A0ABX2KWW7_9PROT|nr:carbohydrate-binding domain-containing protein [Azospirillum formosense]MBY3756427.1 hypothetical protein [Azospirillum formosense]NUB19364.1 hypothetical protein [Azospirillum formosense]